MLFILLMMITGVLVALDQLSKCWAIDQLCLKNQVVSVVDGVFELRYTENPGVAFSMLEGQGWLFIPLTIIVCVLVLVIMYRSPLRRYHLFSVICVLVLSGAIGNLIDRMVYGYVIDFLYFRLIDFPIFNIADCYVVIGSVLLFIFVLFIMKDDDDTPLRTLLFDMKKEKVQGDG